MTCGNCGTVNTPADIFTDTRCKACGHEKFLVSFAGPIDLRAWNTDGLMTVGTALHLTWLAIAIESAANAVEADANGDFDMVFGESILGCTASALAVDAFYGGFRQYVNRPAGLTEETSRNAWIVETAKAGFRLGPITNTAPRDLQWLYRLRDEAVHYGDRLEPPVEHASGVLMAGAPAQWDLHAAIRAVEIAVAFIGRCIHHPDRANVPLTVWCSPNRESFEPIVARWTQIRSDLGGSDGS
jgi:hypothetical protein